MRGQARTPVSKSSPPFVFSLCNDESGEGKSYQYNGAHAASAVRSVNAGVMARRRRTSYAPNCSGRISISVPRKIGATGERLSLSSNEPTTCVRSLP